jgi:hypothetical protein
MLLKGMTEEEAKDFLDTYRRSKKILQRLNQIATEEAAAKLHNIESPKAFEVTNWSHYVAWCSGYRQAMLKFINLTRYESKRR